MCAHVCIDIVNKYKTLVKLSNFSNIEPSEEKGGI